MIRLHVSIASVTKCYKPLRYKPILSIIRAIGFLDLVHGGSDSFQFAGLENTQTAIVDVFPKLRKYKPLVALSICVFCFLLGLTQCTNVSRPTYSRSGNKAFLSSLTPFYFKVLQNRRQSMFWYVYICFVICYISLSLSLSLSL